MPLTQRRTCLAFTQANSDGMKPPRALADAERRAVHLLPTSDLATINEDKGE